MKNRILEWFSVQRARNPGYTVLSVILLFNVLFFLFAAAIISALSLDGTEQMGFVEAAFCTITMILDAGCIQFVIADIGESGVAISLFCVSVVLIGMISFTGGVIGYITNYISHFIENANAGKHRIVLNDHVVILNWNTRGSEIVNDFLYNEHKHKVVVLVNGRKDEIQKEIEERLSDTVNRENAKIAKQYENLPLIPKKIAIFHNRFRNRVTVLVREGDVFSSKQLQDISLERAHSVIILGNDINNTSCRYEQKEWYESQNRGNSQTVKTLMQVADITAAASSNDNQKIIVEVTDDWTWDLVARIIESKRVAGKCDIVPVRVNQVLGQILSQFTLMPELNRVYEEIFSNRGAEIYTRPQKKEHVAEFSERYLQTHRHAIPLTFMDSENVTYCYYLSESEEDLEKRSALHTQSDFSVDLNHEFWFLRKNVVILGHNSKIADIMQGFQSFCDEWNRGNEQAVQIVVIDDAASLQKMNHYQEYPFVIKTVAAGIFDQKLICDSIEQIVDENEEDTSILILSDDSVLNEDLDANALAHLIYVQEIIQRKKKDPDYDPGKIDVVVEIIDPKHHDIVNSYSINNVVISNRYISKMIAQIGEVDALFDFYVDILSYDSGCNGENYESKEIYVKKVTRYLNRVPETCTAAQLIRAVIDASVDRSLPVEQQDPDIVLGYVDGDGDVKLFGGDQAAQEITLTAKDKLIIFSSH